MKVGTQHKWGEPTGCRISFIYYCKADLSDSCGTSDSPRTDSCGNCEAYSICANVMFKFANVGDGDGQLLSRRNVAETSHEYIGSWALFKQTSGLTTLHGGVVFFFCFAFLLDYSVDDTRADLACELNNTYPVVKRKDVFAFLDIDGGRWIDEGLREHSAGSNRYDRSMSLQINLGKILSSLVCFVGWHKVAAADGLSTGPHVVHEVPTGGRKL